MINIILFTVAINAAPNTQSYCYPSQPNLTVKVLANTWEEGYAESAKVCYKAMTDGKYPGESRGLEIIDVCANPRRCK